MKIMLATASLITAATLAACGGHSQAWQDGYNMGLDGGSKPGGAGGHVTSDFYCQGLSASYRGDSHDFIAGCELGFAKGQASPSPTQDFKAPPGRVQEVNDKRLRDRWYANTIGRALILPGALYCAVRSPSPRLR